MKKSQMPREVYIAQKEEDDEVWLHAGESYAEVAEEATITKIGRYQLVETLEVSTLARPTKRIPIK